jgi:hypothetical protein
MVGWLKRIALVVAIAWGVALLWRGLLVFAGLVALLAASIYLGGRWRKRRAVRRFRAAWGEAGKDLLLVYSNSPHWQRYVEETWLARWGHRAVVLNWSERRQWKPSQRAEAALFRAFAGAREFNPLAIVVPPSGSRPRVIRFWLALLSFGISLRPLRRRHCSDDNGGERHASADRTILRTSGISRRWPIYAEIC